MASAKETRAGLASIIGDKDAAEFQGISRLLAKNIHHARHVVIPGAAHLPSMENPDEFNRLMFDFLR
jgi:pimeloyl-ACP methyl ester carboxylesterase